MAYHYTRLILSGLLMISFSSVIAQPEVQAWGNLRGIRVNEELVPFETSLRILERDWRGEKATGKERYWTQYSREGNQQIVRTRIDSLFFQQTVIDRGEGGAEIKVEFDPHVDTLLKGVFFHIRLPSQLFSTANVELISPTTFPLATASQIPASEGELMRVMAQGVSLATDPINFSIQSEDSSTILMKSIPGTNSIEIYILLAEGAVEKGQKVNRDFVIQVKQTTKSEEVRVKLYPEYPGNTFLGLGGNFRIQNPEIDPMVIDYCLKNLAVRMGRVELPWRYWHPEDTLDPVALAKEGQLHPRVRASMEMAQRLHKMGMPVLLAAWFPPPWAAEGEVSWSARNADGTFGNPLRQDKMLEIYASITDYILYLQEAYGVEIAMFSFNESDLGINVRQTDDEHAELIKGLGAYMKSKGLRTKLLLGDTADANGYEFVNRSLDDPETWPYIGAVSFHSWRGWEKETLIEWYEAADRLNVPLIVGEGSIDAAAWRYPKIFKEAHYAMEEIKLYIRILSICQPQSILQWQLTADYSPLIGSGIYGSDANKPLKTTQRFWNLKQLSTTPAGLRNVPTYCDQENVYVAALGDEKQKNLVVHVVNDGPSRSIEIRGIPKKIKNVRSYVTDSKRGMEEGPTYAVVDGVMTCEIASVSFTSFMSE